MTFGRILPAALIIGCFLSAPSVSAAGSTSLVYGIDSHIAIVNDTAYTTDSAPYLYNNGTESITYAPLRYTTEAFGAQVSYDEASRTAAVLYNGKEYVYDLQTRAQVVNDRSYIPLRELMELLEMRVDWYDGLISISENNEGLTPEQALNCWEKIYYNPTSLSAPSNVPTGNFVSFSRPAGLYTQDFDVALSTGLEGGTIYYTTDGSDPTANSTVYTKPIRITNRLMQPASLTGYVTANEGFTIPRTNIMKGTIIKAMAVNSEGAKTPVSVSTYIVSPDILNRYRTDVVCITTPVENLFDSKTGIYMPENCNNKGSEWERKAFMELFDESGMRVVSQPVSLRINGGTTRNYQQKSLRVYAKKNEAYQNGGSKKIKYDIFDGSVKDNKGEIIDKFDTLVLRNFGDDWYGYAMRDSLISNLSRPLSADTLGEKICVVFINGEYWGAHEIRERYDSEYFQSHYNLASDKDVAMAEISEDRNHPTLSEGEETDISELEQQMLFVADSDMTDAQNYEQAEKAFDFDSLIDHYIVNVFFENDDWPVNNIKMWKNKNPQNPIDTKWHFTIADEDNTFVSLSERLPVTHNNVLDLTWWQNNKGGALGYTIEASDGILSKFMRSLMRNDDFSSRFERRCRECINKYFNASSLSGSITEMWNERVTLRQEHIARYQNSWSRENASALIQYARTRPMSASLELDSYMTYLNALK